MSNVQVGLFLTNQQLLGRDQVQALQEQRALLHTAREYGFDSVFAGQHYLTSSFAHIQPLPFLARLAADAGEMRIGMGVFLLALHNPVEVAECFAGLDVVCGGRMIFGVGLGYRQVEYEAFDVPARDKVHRFTENLWLIQALWQGEAVDADLAWCRLQNTQLSLLPVQRPRPPVWMAANSDAAVRRAAQRADTWLINPHATVDTIERQLRLFQAARHDAGFSSPPELPVIREVFCAPTRAEALEHARPHLSHKYQVYAQWGQDRVMPGRESFADSYEQLEQHRFVIGSPEDCLTALLPWRDRLGIDHFIFRTHWPGMPVEYAQRSLELLGREVVPVLRGP